MIASLTHECAKKWKWHMNTKWSTLDGFSLLQALISALLNKSPRMLGRKLDSLIAC